MKSNKTVIATIAFLTAAFSICGCEISVSRSNENANTSKDRADASPAPMTAPNASSATAPCSFPPLNDRRRITVSSPCDGGTVTPRTFVEGMVSRPDMTIWVIIHPVETEDFWVQPLVSMTDNGRWKVLCYFGEAGSAHASKHYEILAISNPKMKLREEQLLAGWPKAESKSALVDVVRE